MLPTPLTEDSSASSARQFALNISAFNNAAGGLAQQLIASAATNGVRAGQHGVRRREDRLLSVSVYAASKA
jgi:hypothetical protein